MPIFGMFAHGFAQRVMICIQAQIPYYRFEQMAEHSDTIVQFVSTRNGVRDNRFTIGLNGYAADSQVLANRQMLAAQHGFEPSAFVFAEQVHGNVVEYISPDKRGRGAFSRSTALPHCDAMITHHPNICLVAQAADCVPILFYDPVKKAIGAAHAGWRGTAAKIAAAVVGAFQERYSSDPRDILVGIGPSIGPCCYEVGDEVAQQVREAFPDSWQAVLQPSPSGKHIFNLWQANRITLLAAGITPQNMEVAEICTRCNNHQFFSARAGDHGRFGAFIMLR